MSKATKPTTLLDSAVEFLIEAFSNYNAKKPRFAMVHAVTTAELVLKERLARIRSNLIFKDIDAVNFALSLNSCGENSVHPLRTFLVRSGIRRPRIFWRSGSAYSKRRRIVPIRRAKLRRVLTAAARAAFFLSVVPRFFVICAAQITTCIKNVPGADDTR
jgi:hypothetical protein